MMRSADMFELRRVVATKRGVAGKKLGRVASRSSSGWNWMTEETRFKQRERAFIVGWIGGKHARNARQKELKEGLSCCFAAMTWAIKGHA